MKSLRCPSRLVAALTLACAIVVLLDGGARALLHLDDLSGIQHIAGIWMALAQYSDAGVLYPPLQADGVYAGTRYMPLCFGLIAGLAKLVGDYVMAAKLMALASMAALLAAMFAVVRRITGRSLDAFVLTGLLLALPEGLTALLSPHADALAVALALGGLLLIAPPTMGGGRGGDRGRSWLAAGLFTAAVGTKFSALAGPAAAGLFLARRDPRRAAGLLLIWLVLTALGLLLLNGLSAGRFADNFRSLASGGMSLESVRFGPSRVTFALSQRLPFALLLPLALVTLYDHWRERCLGLWDWYFVFTAGTTLLIFTSPGTDFNHLLELEVATVLVIAQLCVGGAGVPAFLGATARLLVLAVLLGSVCERAFTWTAPAGPAAVPGSAVVAALPPEARILAEDATVPVLLGRRPVVMDPFAYRVLAERGLIDDRELADRVNRQEFDVLVLLGRVDRPGESLCPQFHFGPRVTAAMQEAYRFDRQVGPYFLFVPNVATGPEHQRRMAHRSGDTCRRKNSRK